MNININLNIILNKNEFQYRFVGAKLVLRFSQHGATFPTWRWFLEKIKSFAQKQIFRFLLWNDNHFTFLLWNATTCYDLLWCCEMVLWNATTFCEMRYVVLLRIDTNILLFCRETHYVCCWEMIQIFHFFV